MADVKTAVCKKCGATFEQNTGRGRPRQLCKVCKPPKAPKAKAVITEVIAPVVA
jgi:predicted Zn-ribbon and HTH transcriptional regulator